MWVWKLAADVGMTVVVEGGGLEHDERNTVEHEEGGIFKRLTTAAAVLPICRVS